MTVGILLITHSGIGQAFISTLTNTFGELAMPMEEIPIGRDPNPERLIEKGIRFIEKLDTGSGVLVLTDMIGSTPCNIAQGIQSNDVPLRVITGVNLPMLFRIHNYAGEPLDVLARKALSAGREGILEPNKETTQLVILETSNRKNKKKLNGNVHLYDPKTNTNY